MYHDLTPWHMIIKEVECCGIAEREKSGGMTEALIYRNVSGLK